jgi:hypothetical protein
LAAKATSAVRSIIISRVRDRKTEREIEKDYVLREQQIAWAMAVTGERHGAPAGER